MGFFKRRDRKNKTDRHKQASKGGLLRGLVSFDLLEKRVLFAVLPAPTGMAATAPSTNEVDLSWNDSGAETGYNVQVNTGTVLVPAWTNVTTSPIAAGTDLLAVTAVPTTSTGLITAPLAPGTSYSFRLIAIDADGNSPAGAFPAAPTVTNAPTLSAGATTSSSVTVSWTAVTGAASYLLDRSPDLTNWTNIASPTSSTLSYTDSAVSLTANTTYYYRLRAVNASAIDSDYSFALAATTNVAAPTSVTATAVSPSQIAVTWPPVAGAYGYVLQQKGGTVLLPTWTSVGGNLSSSTNVYVVSNLIPNTAYNFRLVASNNTGASTPSSTAGTSTLTAAPVLTTSATSTVANGLAWTAVTGATSYVIQRSPDGANWTQLATPIASAVSYADSSPALTADTEYFYRMAVVNLGGTSAWSNVAAQTTNIAANSAVTSASASSYGITVSWASQPTASGFKLQLVGGTVLLPTYTQVGDIIAAGSTSYTVTGLTPNTAYTYRLITENEAGDSAASANTTASTRLVRTRVTGSATSDTTVVLNWTNVTGNTGYKVESSTDNATWTVDATTAANAITYTDSGLTAFVGATPYYFRIVVTSANGDSSASNVIKRTTLLPVPTTFAAATPTTTGMTLSWDQDTGDTGYVVQKQINSTWVTLTTLATDTNTYAVTGLHAGNAYNFRVMAKDAGGLSAPATVTASTLPKATVVTATATASGNITVSWAPVHGAVTYEVDSAPDGTTWGSIATPAAGTTTFSDTTVAADTPQYYRVFAVNSAGNAAFSNTAQTSTVLAAPTTFAATSLSDTSISLSWDPQVTAIGFRLEKSVGSTWPQVGNLIAAGATSYIVPNITANTAYTFRLIAVNAGGDSTPSATATATTKVPAPVVALGAFTDTTVGLTWPAIANATGYKIQRSTSPNNGFSFLGNATLPVLATAPITYSDATASQGSTYYYRVTATNLGGDSLTSNIVTQTTLMTAPATPTAVSSEPTSIDLAWTAVPGATGYIVQQQGATASIWTPVGSALAGTVDSLNVGSLTAGTAYTFRIIAVDASGNSVASATATATTLLAAPAPAVVAASTTGITVTWPSITHATGYLIERSVDDATWAQIAAPTAAVGASQTYLDNTVPLTADTEYFYRLRTVDGSNSAYSAVVSTHTLLAAPSSVVATSISASEIDLAWAAQPTATAFIVQQQGGTVLVPTWTQVGDAVASGSTGVALTGLSTKTAYSYRVIAVNDGGNSIASSTVSATTSTAVARLVGMTQSSTSVALTWHAVAGATGYKVLESPDNITFTPLTPTLGATTTNFTATALTNDTTYYFAVVVTSAGADSAASNVTARHTLLPAPTTFAIVADSTNPTTSLDLSWDQSTGNTGYIVERLLGTVWTTYATLTTGTNTDVITGLTPNVNYTFRVRAINAGGNSAPSTAASLATT
jgi:titin